MSAKTDWNSLTHEQRLTVLRETPVDRIVQEYFIPNATESVFRLHLARERELWRPRNVTELKKKGQAPTKDVVLGAWRDLDRAEALLELIDNSIDGWLRRREDYP